MLSLLRRALVPFVFATIFIIIPVAVIVWSTWDEPAIVQALP